MPQGSYAAAVSPDLRRAYSREEPDRLDVATTLPDLAALVAHYRDLLGLRDWEIAAEWVSPDEIPGALACIEPVPTRKLARIRVSTACPAEELRATVAHELVHALLSPLTAVTEPSAGAVVLEEQAVEALALAVVRAEGVDAAVLARALEGLPARLRARLSATQAPAGATRSRMDPELIKKVIAAIKEGNGDAALSMLEEMLTAAASGGEPDGDEVSMEEAAPPGDDAPPPAEPKAEAAKPGDEQDEAYRALGRVAAELLGASDAKARGRLRGMLEAAKTADTATAEAERIRRDRAWEKAIQSGRARAGQVWQTAIVGGKRGKVAAAWRKGVDGKFPDVAELEGYLETLPRIAGGGNEQPDTATVDAGENARPGVALARVTLTEKQAARARAQGVDPDVLAAAVPASQRGLVPAEET